MNLPMMTMTRVSGDGGDDGDGGDGGDGDGGGMCNFALVITFMVMVI